jgi:membrane protein YdbS with pleckstrin-like domain
MIETVAQASPVVHAQVQRLHPAIRWVWLGGAAIAAMVILIASLIAEAILRGERDWPLPWGVSAVLTATVIGGWSAVYSLLRYQNWGYLLREKDVVIQSGVWWKVRRCIPRSRVQHVDISSGPLDRAFGLVQVHLFTAGGMGAVAEIPGLSPEAAEDLRAALVRSSSDGV